MSRVSKRIFNQKNNITLEFMDIPNFVEDSNLKDNKMGRRKSNSKSARSSQRKDEQIKSPKNKERKLSDEHNSINENSNATISKSKEVRDERMKNDSQNQCGI